MLCEVFAIVSSCAVMNMMMMMMMMMRNLANVLCAVLMQTKSVLV